MVTTFGPLQINRYNSKRNARVQLTIQDRPLSEVFQEVTSKITSNVAFPVGYSIVPFGAVNELRTLMDAVRFVFPLSVVVVYLLLVMQFQSFVRPLSIMLSVPLSIIGANFLVTATRTPFDSFTMLGYIMMVGLVVKNAILLITYAVQAHGRRCGTRRSARAGQQTPNASNIYDRHRHGIGHAPIGAQKGAGAEIYNGLAMAVVGGLGVATLLTLVFVPIVYTLVDGTMNKLRRFLRISH